ncbi:MAG: carbonic anhydrase [Alphaproteobacteria bacterium]|nr:carbonic anhydrase [Alphaproteobacteria bacterium]
MPLPQPLASGYGRFLTGRFEANRRQFELLAEAGQHPGVMVVSCCDSRVTPEVIFDAEPGQLFVMRNVANLVPPHETVGRYHGVSAALEFAVLGLRVQHVIVLGHSLCGGVRAYLDEIYSGDSGGDFIGSWMSLLARSREDVLLTMAGQPRDAVQRALEQRSIRSSLANLRTFGCVKTLEERGRLHLHGAHFDIGTGQLALLQEEDEVFRPVAPAATGRP